MLLPSCSPSSSLSHVAVKPCVAVKPFIASASSSSRSLSVRRGQIVNCKPPPRRRRKRSLCAVVAAESLIVHREPSSSPKSFTVHCHRVVVKALTIHCHCAVAESVHCVLPPSSSPKAFTVRRRRPNVNDTLSLRRCLKRSTANAVAVCSFRRCAVVPP